MTNSVTDTQDVANSGNNDSQSDPQLSNKELNFRRLEAQRDQEKEARMRAEMQNEAIKKEVESLKEFMRPKEKDPLDDIQDLSELEPSKLKEILAYRDQKVRREAEDAALKRFEDKQKEYKRANFRDDLRGKYNDYDDVMNQDVLTKVQEVEADALDAISSIEDPYVRCEKAYKFVKNKLGSIKEEKKPSINERVAENLQNPYMIPGMSGSPAAIEFDVRSSSAKKEAYEKLKAAQRRPIGGGSPFANS